MGGRRRSGCVATIASTFLAGLVLVVAILGTKIQKRTTWDTKWIKPWGSQDTHSIPKVGSFGNHQGKEFGAIAAFQHAFTPSHFPKCLLGTRLHR